jgi:hypothetical protein
MTGPMSRMASVMYGLWIILYVVCPQPLYVQDSSAWVCHLPRQGQAVRAGGRGRLTMPPQQVLPGGGGPASSPTAARPFRPPRPLAPLKGGKGVQGGARALMGRTLGTDCGRWSGPAGPRPPLTSPRAGCSEEQRTGGSLANAPLRVSWRRLRSRHSASSRSQRILRSLGPWD